MGAKFDHIPPKQIEFIAAQQMFFVATAAPTGTVNVSPKGQDSLRVLGPNRVAWQNWTGSGNETAAHVLANPRMTLMWCSFGAKPNILRLYGTARMIQPPDAEWAELAGLFPEVVGARQIFDMRVDLAHTSCGFGVPLMEFVGQREVMPMWANTKGEEGSLAYQDKHNRVSLDGFPTGLPQR